MEPYDGVAQDAGAHQSGWHPRWTARIGERLAARVWCNGCQQGHRIEHGSEMAWPLATNHYGHLCQRRRGGGAEHRIEESVVNLINLITPGQPTRCKSGF